LTQSRSLTRVDLLLAAVVALAVLGGGYLIAGDLLFGTDRRVQAPAKLETSQVIALGKKLYGVHCASCHGVNLEGEKDWRTRNPDGTLKAPPHDASGHTWHHSDDLLFRYTKFGGSKVVGGAFKSAMPGFGDQLKDHEIWAILGFIKSMWPKEIRERQAQISGVQR